MKTALIIGASGDIGSAIAERMAAAGWSLTLHYHHHEARVVALADKLMAQYPKQDFLTVCYDLTDVIHTEQLVNQLFAVDAVVFAAGMTYYHLFKDTTVDELTTLMRVHVVTPMRILTQLQDKLARSGHGRIVFIGSVYGGSGSAMEVAYSTVKGAQSAFVRAYAKEVASLGLTVNVVAPGAVATQMNTQMFDEATLAGVQEAIPAARLALPSDIAYYVAMLMNDEAQYLTGQTLYVTGGWLR